MSEKRLGAYQLPDRVREGLKKVEAILHEGQEATTHWRGCEEVHLRCRVAKLVRELLEEG